MVLTGLDRFLTDTDNYRGCRIALIANQTSVTRELVYSWDALRARGLDLRRIFSPEHGIFAVEQDQAPVREQALSGTELVSLYGSSADSLIPDNAALDDIDLVLFDIQDVGTRYYTYVNTMALFMRALAGRDIEFMVLDRPNPLGGLAVEGPPLTPGYESFVGVFNVPVRHGLTAGELARFYKKEHGLDITLAVTPMGGWSRDNYFDGTGLPWVPPSPNMPTLATALVYPGMCLLEGTNISEGRGTTTPFEIAGAPFVESERLSERLNSMNLPGVYFRPVSFRPTFNKFGGMINNGVYIHVTGCRTYLPFLTGVAFVKAMRGLYGDDITFPHGVYEFNDTHPAFDLLAGGADIREMILAGVELNDISASWRESEREFVERRREFLLY
jgi:uncharacterized protein YbbC (DUF1343 family)